MIELKLSPGLINFRSGHSSQGTGKGFVLLRAASFVSGRLVEDSWVATGFVEPNAIGEELIEVRVAVVVERYKLEELRIKELLKSKSRLWFKIDQYLNVDIVS